MNALYRILMAMILLQQINAQTYPMHVISSNQMYSYIVDHSAFYSYNFDIADPKNYLNSYSSFDFLFLFGNNTNGNRIYSGGNWQFSNFFFGPYYKEQNLREADKINFRTVWTAYRQDIEDHRKDFFDNGKIDIKRPSIYKWPGKNNPHFEAFNHFVIAEANYPLASFYDQNRDGNYNPDDGDFPWISPTNINNLPNEINFFIYHGESSLKMEFALTSYVYHCLDNNVLDRSIFYSCRMTHKDEEFGVVKNCKIGMKSDRNLACPTDDYVGSIPSKNSIYWYNKDNTDGDSIDYCSVPTRTFGYNPPVLSLTFLNGPMDIARMHLVNEIYTTDIWTSIDRISTPVTNPITGEMTSYCYPDNPNLSNAWSMFQTNAPAYYFKNVYTARNEEDFNFNESKTLDFVYTYHHHPDSNHLQNVNLAYQNIDQIQQIYNNFFSLQCIDEPCNEECVWPADTDDDGVVDYLDAVNILKTYQQTGQKSTQSWIWNGRKSKDWNYNIPAGLNAKYADANADGIIDYKDLKLIEMYYGNKHGDPQDKRIDCSTGDDIILTIDSAILNKNFKRIKVLFKSSLPTMIGLSYKLMFDLNIWYSGSINIISLWQDSSIKTNWFMYRYNENNFDGSSAVGINYNNINEKLSNQAYISLSLKSPNSKIAKITEIAMCDIKAYLEDGTIIPLHSNRLVLDLSTITGTEIHVDDELDILPNPAHDIITISGLTLKYIMNIYNSNGRLMSSHTINNSSQNISVANLNSGIYILELKNSKHTIIKKLVISK